MSEDDPEQLSIAASIIITIAGAQASRKGGHERQSIINVAAAEKLSAMEVASYSRERAKRANIPEALASPIAWVPSRRALAMNFSLTVQTGPSAPEFRPENKVAAAFHGSDRAETTATTGV